MKLDTLPPELRNTIVGKALGVPGLDERGQPRHLLHPLRRLVAERMSVPEKDKNKDQEPVTEAERDYMSISSTCQSLRESCRFFARQASPFAPCWLQQLLKGLKQILSTQTKATFDAASDEWVVDEIKSSSDIAQHTSALLASLHVVAQGHRWNETYFSPSRAETALPAALRSLAAGWAALHALTVGSKQGLLWLPAILDALPRRSLQLTELEAIGILALSREPYDDTVYDSPFDPSLEAVARCRSLKWLKLQGTDTTIEVFYGPHLRPYEVLERLRDLDELDDLEIRHYLLAPTEIRRPDVRDLSVQGEPFSRWESLPNNLRHLRLEVVYVADDGGIVKLIHSVCSTLETLEVIDCRLPWMSESAREPPKRCMTALLHLVVMNNLLVTNVPLLPSQLLHFASPTLRTLTVDHLLSLGEGELTRVFTGFDPVTLEKVHIRGSTSEKAKDIKEMEATLISFGVETTLDFTERTREAGSS